MSDSLQIAFMDSLNENMRALYPRFPFCDFTEK